MPLFLKKSYFSWFIALFIMSSCAPSAPKNKQIKSLQEPQFFSISNTKDTLLATKAGVLLYIRKGSFASSKGLVFDTVKVEVKEAFTVLDALSNSLVTMSVDGQFLQTGGMLYVDATSPSGELLEIATDKVIKVEIPMQEESPSNAQLYKGRKEKDYIIWEDPQPLKERKMVALPLKYLSLYGTYFDKTGKWSSQSVSWKKDSISCRADSISRKLNLYYLGVPKDKMPSPEWAFDPFYINTWVATREFEARAFYLNRYCLDSIALMYLNNTNKNLWEVDEMAYSQLKATAPHIAKYFKQFAEQKCTVIEKDLLSESELANLQKERSRPIEQTIEIGSYTFGLIDLRVWCNIDAPITFGGWKSKLFKQDNRLVVLENENLYDAWDTYMLVGASGTMIPYSYVPSDIQTTAEKMALFTIAMTKKGDFFYQIISLEANSPLPKQVAVGNQVANVQELDKALKSYMRTFLPSLPASKEYGKCCSCTSCLMRGF